MLFNQDLYNDLIGYLGIEPGNGLPDTDNRVLMAMNAGLQKIWTKGPYYLRRQRGACVLPSPQAVTFNVTNNSVTISGNTSYTAQMLGCMVRIQGEPGDNEFVNGTTLLVPITQATGTVTATVYFNTFTLPPGVTGVSGNVFLDDTAWELQPYFYEDQQMFKQWPRFPVDPYYILQSSLYIRLKVGVPTGYYVVPAQVQTGPTYSLQLKVWPVPSNQHTITFVQEMGPPKLTLTSLELGNPQPTPTLITPLPGDMHETAWLPLARMALSSYPHFLESKREYVAQESSDALEYLKSLTPQRQSGAQLRPQTFMAN
jgi:hypothetical protein